MPVYMTQFAYTQEAMAELVKNPEDREEVVRGLIEDQLGGELISFYWAFGEYDGVAIYRADDNVHAAAGALAAIVPGHLTDVKTTVLLESAERLEALKLAGGATIQGPG